MHGGDPLGVSSKKTQKEVGEDIVELLRNISMRAKYLLSVITIALDLIVRT